MEQHSVPQHIASFEFKLFGNLTIRQFVTLAIPMGIALLIFFSQLPAIIRLPLALIFGLLGLFASLVPIGGRPFDKWIVAFAKSILSPTQRVWIKEQKLPEFLDIVVAPPPSEGKIPETITAQGRERLLAYLRSLPKGEFSPFDVKEQVALQRLDLEQPAQIAGQGQLPKPIIWPTSSYQEKRPVFASEAAGSVYAQASLPQVANVPQVSMAQSVPAREFGETLKESLPTLDTGPVGTTGRISPHAKPYILSGLEQKLRESFGEKRGPVELIKTPIAQLASETNFSIENIIPIRISNKRLKFLAQVGKTRVRKLHFAPPENFDLTKLPIRGERTFEISQELKRQMHFLDNEPLEPKPETSKAQEISRKEPATPHLKAVPRGVHLVPKPTHSLKAPEGVFLKPKQGELVDSRVSISKSKSVHFPRLTILPKAQIVPLTNRPNVISGLVSDASGTPLEGAIIIVRDQNGIPLRALKTNKLGQFLSATSLANGTYSIEIESDFAKFDLVTITLTGQVLAPMEIKANKQLES